jgi:hypothetical protein
MEYIEDSHLFKPAALGMMKLLVLALLVIHILGGLWYFIGSTYANDHNWVVFWMDAQKLHDPPLLELYFASVYFVSTTLTTTVRLVAFHFLSLFA